jgi:hypothetical protein
MVNMWVFRTYFGRNYIDWYLSAGPFIALATAAFGAAWGSLDKNPALVSANPLIYFSACLQVAGLPLVAIGAHMRSRNRLSPIGLEVLPICVLAISLAVSVVAWLLLVVPMQYFLFLFAGAPSRVALTSSARVSARIQSGQVALMENTDVTETAPEDGWWDASMRNKPVTLASAYGAALLFLLGLLW